MLNVLIADDNIYYVKNLVNFVISKNSNIKIVNIASTGLEVLEAIKENPNIDLILLDLKMPELNGIKTLDKLYNMNLTHYPNILVISGENNLIKKIVNHPLVTDFVNKSDDMITVYNKLLNYEKQLKFSNSKEELSKKISSELIYIGYNPSHLGTQYIKECILEIYEKNCSEYSQNLENYLYKQIAFSHGKSFQNVKSNIIKATNFMYAESDMSILKNYFHFNDNKRKPTPKIVISTILSKL
ncbi:MAG: response regulator transcription factor [Clostridia bacterium]